MSSSWVEMVSELPQLHLTDEANAGSYSYKYASLPSILEAIRPTLSEHGWVVTQDVTTTDAGQPQVTTIFDSAEGEVYQRRYGPLTVPATGSGAQAVGSAITYARRYALVAALGLAPDGDDDGQAASRPHVRAEAPQASIMDDAWGAVVSMASERGESAKDLWWEALDKCGVTDPASMDVATAGRVTSAARGILERSE